jgi:fucose permease
MPSLSPRATLVLICTLYLASGLTLASIGPNLSTLATNSGQDISVIGSLFTAFSLGTVLAQLPVPWLTARYGQRAVLTLGIVMMGTGVLGESLSRSLALLLSMGLLAGLGFGTILASGNLLVAQLFAHRSTSVLNLINLFFGVGSIIGPLIASWTRVSIGSSLATLWLGAGMFFLLAPVATLVPATARSSSRVTDRATPPWGLIMLFGLLLLVYSGIEIAIGGWSTIYLNASTGMALEQAAIAVSGFWLALTIGRGIGSILGLRLEAITLLRLAIGLLLAGTILLAISVGDVWRSVVALLIIGVASGPIFPSALALIARITQGHSSAIALTLAVANMGGALIPPLIGMILRTSGPHVMATTLLLLSCTVVLLFGLTQFTRSVESQRSPSI